VGLNAYLLTSAGFLLLGGVRDLYRHRSLCLSESPSSCLASLACGLSTTAVDLRHSRTVQGVGGCRRVGVSLSPDADAVHYPADRRRRRWASSASSLPAAAASGVVLGGSLTRPDQLALTFLVNVRSVSRGSACSRCGCCRVRGPDDVLTARRGGAVTVPSPYARGLRDRERESERWTSAETTGPAGPEPRAPGLFLVIESLGSPPLVPLGLFKLRTSGSPTGRCVPLGLRRCSLVLLAALPQQVSGFLHTAEGRLGAVSCLRT